MGFDLQMKKRMTLTFISGAGVEFLRLFLGVLVIPLLARFWGMQTVGIYFLFLSIGTYAALLSVSFIQSFIRELTPVLVGRKPEYREVYSTGFWICNSVGLLSAIVAAFLVPLVLPSAITSDPSMKTAILKWMSLLFIFVVCQFLGTSLRVNILALGKNYLTNRISYLKMVVSASSIVVLAWLGYGISIVLVALIVAEIGSIILHYLQIRTLFPDLPMFPTKFSWRRAKVTMAYSSQILLGRIAGLLIFRLDEFIISRLIGIELVAVYGVALRVFMILWAIILLPTRSLQAEYSRLKLANEKIYIERCRDLSNSISRYIYYIFAITCIPIILLAKPIIYNLFSIEYAQAATVLIILLSLNIITTPYQAAWHFNIIEGLYRYNLIHVWGVAFCNIALAIYLAPRYGIEGVALAKVFAFMLVSPYIITRVKQTFNFGWREWLRKVVFPSYGILFLLFAVNGSLVVIFPRPDSLALIFLWLAVLFFINIAICAKFAITPSEYGWIVEVTSQRIPRLRPLLALMRPVRRVS